MVIRVLKVFSVLFWMSLIFCFSMDSGVISTAKSDGFIVRVSEIVLRRKLTEKEKNRYVDEYQFYVRKAAHFILYFCLSLSFIWLLKDFCPFGRKLVLFTTLFIFFYACSDEIHQLFVQERSGQFKDVLIDTLGGINAILLIYLIHSYRKKIQN